MLTSLAFIFLVGLSLAAICQTLKLPRIIGMLITGILLGPYVLNVLDPSILSISSELRQIALIIILLKAGLSLNLADLKKVGRPAIMMACIPATFEILAYFLLAPYFLGITRLEAAVMGAVMGAVSPAVVVPRMVQLMDEKYGTAKSIPQMILAGASCDDIYVIHKGKIVLHEEMDTILEKYAVLKVSEEQYRAMDKRYLLKERKEFFGISCLTNEKQYYIENYPEIVVESGSLDQVILMLTGGER